MAETVVNIMKMERIVLREGGYREKSVLEKPHTVERSETWNDDHKVLNILSTEPDADGYRNGFQVDLITRSICG